jgi:xanthine/CO dehydrogenase XdhC/CoxF family maturation factor
MSFDTRRRFGCAGKIDIFVERVSEGFLVDLAARVDARQSCHAITVFEGNRSGSRIVKETAGFRRDDKLVPDRDKTLVQKIHPPIQLLIFGLGPDSAPIRNLSKLLGWQPMEIIDTNNCSIEADAWTAAIVKSHNYGRDFTALQKLLPLNLRYVGLIGPRKRRDQLLNDLLEIGVAINAGFFAPAGLNIGAETPEEIGLAIISEIQRVLAKGSGESLRERRLPIHTLNKSAHLFSPNEWSTSAR